MDGGEPDIPIYKVIECIGPTNTRVYTVAVYFRGKRLASSTGHSIQQAEMKSAKAALENSSELFPQLDYQKRVIAQSIKRQKGKEYAATTEEISKISRRNVSDPLDDESYLPRQYRTREDISSEELDMSSDENGKNIGKELKMKRNKRKRTKKEQQPNDRDGSLFSPLSDDSQVNEGSKSSKNTTIETPALIPLQNSVAVVGVNVLEDMSDDEIDESMNTEETTPKSETVLFHESSLESGETD